MRFVETGDRQLANRLVTANLRLVLKIVLEYRVARNNLIDLVQEGNFGLMHAVDKYDPRRGVKLNTYASWWIRAYVLKFILSNARLVKLGTTQAQRRIFFGVRKARAALEKHGTATNAKELASTIGVREKEVVEMERRMSACEASLDAPCGRRSQENRTFGDTLTADRTSGPDAQSEEVEFNGALKSAVDAFAATLEGRDLDIFRDRILNEDAPTLAAIADRHGVSRERIRQIEARLKMKCRQHLQFQLGDAVAEWAETPASKYASAAVA